MSQPERDERLAGADGVRALACFGVLVTHLCLKLSWTDQPPWLASLQSFLLRGSWGVSAFFVLSGLLLALPFWRRYLGHEDFPKLRGYFVRRARRIVPGYILCLWVSFAFGMLLLNPSQADWWRLFCGTTFLSSLSYLTLFPVDLNLPLWSIGFEVFCYLLLPLCMVGLFALPGRGAVRGAFYWIAVWGVVLAGHWLILTYDIPPGDRGWAYGVLGGAKAWWPHHNPVGFFAHFIMGVWAAGFVAWRQSRDGGKHWCFDIIATASMAVVVLMLWKKRYEPEMAFSWLEQPYFFPYFAGLVALLLATSPFSHCTGRLLDNPWARFTARISFGLYLWQFLLFELISRFYDPRFTFKGFKDPRPISGVQSPPCCWLTSWGLFPIMLSSDLL